MCARFTSGSVGSRVRAAGTDSGRSTRLARTCAPGSRSHRTCNRGKARDPGPPARDRRCARRGPAAAQVVRPAVIDDPVPLVRHELDPGPTVLRRTARPAVPRADVVQIHVDRRPLAGDAPIHAERGLQQLILQLVLDGGPLRRRVGKAVGEGDVHSGERVIVVLPGLGAEPRGHRAIGREPVAAGHVAAAARERAAFGRVLREETMGPFFVGALDVPAGGAHDVMAAPAEPGCRLGAAPVVDRRVRRRVDGVLDGIHDPGAHDGVIGEMQRVVERMLRVHAVGRVAEEARDAAQLRRELRRIDGALTAALGHGHRRVALEAKRAECTLRFPLPAAVHRDEHGVVGGIGVHAPGPLVVVCRVAALARPRIHERLARRLGQRLRRGGRAMAARRERRERRERRQRRENERGDPGPSGQGGHDGSRQPTVNAPRADPTTPACAEGRPRMRRGPAGRAPRADRGPRVSIEAIRFPIRP